MGTVPQTEATNLEVARGTIEQAMLSTGLNSLVEMVQDPNVIAKSALDAMQTGFSVAAQATQNPSALSIGLLNQLQAQSMLHSHLPIIQEALRKRHSTNFELERTLKSE